MDLRRFPRIILGIVFTFVLFVQSRGVVQAISPTPELSASSAAVTTTLPLQMVKPTYLRGKVVKILEEKTLPGEDGQRFYTQQVQVRRLDTQELVEVAAGSEFQPLNERQRLSVGLTVILAEQTAADGGTEFVVADVYRLPILIWLLIGFLVIVVLTAGRQGAFSIVGMVLNLVVLMAFIVPQILAGQNPLLISIVGGTLVAIATIYLSHGWNRESHLALLSMVISLSLVAVLSSIAVQLAMLSGLGNEEAFYLQFGASAHINLQGLLLGGIMLGALGLLDDICIAQVSVVDQLRAAKPDISFTELYERSMAVGKDHVASLVNTLVLAYAGSSLPLFLLFSMNQTQPAWVSLNMEMISEEVVRTLTGSIGLVLSVPIATLLACYVASRTTAIAAGKPSVRAHHHH